MRNLFLLTLLVGCTPESHTLLGSMSGDGGPADPASDYLCEDAETTDLHGLACGDAEMGSAGGGCGGEAAPGIPAWWAGCSGLPGTQPEWLVVRGTGVSARDEPCEGALEVGAEQIVLESVDGACFQALACGRGVRWSLCQAPGRTSLRPDAVSTPFATCEEALATARDGDPCTPGLRCGGWRDHGPRPEGGRASEALLLYCDDEGITRLVHADGFWFIG